MARPRGRGEHNSKQEGGHPVNVGHCSRGEGDRPSSPAGEEPTLLRHSAKGIRTGMSLLHCTSLQRSPWVRTTLQNDPSPCD